MTAPVAELRNATKTFGSVLALDALSLEVRAGEILALLGHNGAGKTTATRLLLGILGPSSGSARVFGRDPHDRAARVRVGSMLQISGLPATLSVREHIELFSSYYPAPLSLEETLTFAHLEKLQRRLFGDLSGGERQRLFFALAICGDPDLLVLDEPTVGLDVETRRLLWDRIRGLAERGKSVLLTTHYIEEADALAHRVAVLAKGKLIAEGTCDQIKARASGARIRCRSTLGVEGIRRIAGVASARLTERGEIEIAAEVADVAVRALYANDASFELLDVTHLGLEDAFLTLTREAA